MNETLYPLTIIADRYGGTYSGGAFTAWNCYHWGIPQVALGDDIECDMFWCDYRAGRTHYVIGIGTTPDMAIMDLKLRLVIGMIL